MMNRVNAGPTNDNTGRTLFNLTATNVDRTTFLTSARVNRFTKSSKSERHPIQAYALMQYTSSWSMCDRYQLRNLEMFVVSMNFGNTFQ